MLTYLAPFLVFGLVVFVHELGHFLAAKMTGVYAPVFSLGWGSRLFGFRRGETDYRVSWFPIGGYVRMATREDDSMAGIEGGADRGGFDGAPAPAQPSALWDENSMAPFGPKPVPESRFVESKSTPARVFILSAGVLMNILLALVVSSSVFYAYGKPSHIPAMIDSVVTGMPAANAGFKHNDEIISVNGVAVKSWDEAVSKISPATEGTLTLEVRRGTEHVSATITPQVSEVVDSATKIAKKVARVGIQVRNDTIVYVPVGPLEAMRLSGVYSWSTTKEVANTLKGLVTGRESLKNLGGPIAIARVSVQSARAGAENLWMLIALLSLNIAMLNLVPIPVLDGGQILLVLAERIKGSAFSSGVREGFARVGVFAVLGLFLLVMFNDVKSWIN